MKLRNLIHKHDRTGYVFADRGSGYGFGEDGKFIFLNERFEGCEDDLLELELVPLDTPHVSLDGHVCRYASAWRQVPGEPGNYEYRVYF